jgi:SAM-dependent methyltransferase
MSSRTPPAFYERASLNVETYDVRTEAELPLQPDLAGDVAFYLDLAARSGGPVLELGCGTGRVSWPLAAAGLEVVGLDLSPAMLGRAEAKRASVPAEVSNRIEFVEGDMAAFELGRRFRLVIVPFRAFSALLEPAQQRSCLSEVRRHVEPGGQLVIDLFDPRLEWCLPSSTVSPRSGRDPVRHPETGNTVTVAVISRENDPFRQQFTEVWQFRELGPDGSVIRDELERLAMRWTYRWEMHHLLELSGFEVIAGYGDFRGGPQRYGSEQVWVARTTESATGSAAG